MSAWKASPGGEGPDIQELPSTYRRTWVETKGGGRPQERGNRNTQRGYQRSGG